MKKIYLLIVLCSLTFTATSLNIISEKVNDKKNFGINFKEVKLFQLSKDQATSQNNLSEIVNVFTLLEYNSVDAVRIISESPENILFSIPISDHESIDLEIFQSSILTPDFNVLSESSYGSQVNYKKGLHYWGVIKGDNTSICAISIFDNEIMGIISSPSIGNIVIGKLKNSSENLHILYNDADMVSKPMLNCLTENDNLKYRIEDLVSPSAASVNCIRIYWELNYDIFQDKGSINNATNYAIGLFNQSALLYANDGIPVELSQLFVWDVPSPYTAVTTPSLLNQFQATRNSFTGDLGNLLGYSGGGGVAASVNGLCATNLDLSQCYSGINDTFQLIPVYSWSVEVVTHEQGHLMGSRHTHSCVWNGNNTAIDDCGPTAGYPYEGSCSGAPTPTGGGTIMSYCHLVSSGINLSLGFGSQPAAVIINKYNNSTCLGACTGGSFCSTPTGGSTGNISTTTATFNWSPVGSSVSYNIQYRLIGTLTWSTDTTTINNYNVSGLIPGSNYEWQVQAVCSSSTSLFSSSIVFITVPLVCNFPININAINITSVSSLLTWTPAIAAIGYNIQYRISGSGTWNTVTTTGTTYFLSGLIPQTNYEWQIQTICAGGGTSTYSSLDYFSTNEGGAPVTIIIQPDGKCGKDALIGSNVQIGTNVNNYGNTSEFNALAWTAQGASSNHRSLIQFDLSFIPPGSAVTSAYFSLYWDPISSNTGHSSLSGPNNAVINKIKFPWSELGVTWMNQPVTDTTNQAFLPASTSNNQNYLNIDVRNLVQDFVNNPTTNYGMMIQQATETPYRSLIFASSDHTDPNLHPKLEVTYAPNSTECLSLQYSDCYGIDAIIGNCVLAGYPNSNFGSNQAFEALSWTYSGTITDLRSLIYWDLSSIPTNAIVDSAKVTLFWNPTSSNPGHSSMSGLNESVLLKIRSPWTEDLVTWNNQPATDTTNQAYLSASTSSHQDYEIDVTGMVQGMVSNPATNYGMMLKLINESYFRSLIFCSSDHPDPARHPRIDVCYSIPTDISSIPIDNGIKVWHDLTSETIYVKSKINFEQETCFLIYTSEGKCVSRSNNLKGDVFSINTSGFSTGVYFYQFISKSKIKTGKIIVR